MRDDEIDLWRRFRAGDQQAHEELLEFYKGLVEFWVKQVILSIPRADRDDLRQEGMLKLEELIHRFDPDKKKDFVSFAGRRIRDALFYSWKRSHDLPDYQYRIYRKILKAQDELMRSSGNAPTVEEIARKANLTPKQVNRALDAMSVSFPVEFIDPEVNLPAGAIINENPDNVILIGELLLKLDHRERLILTEFYYWGQTDFEISRKIDLEEDNVKRIRQRALKKLRKLLSDESGGEQHED